MNFTKVKDIGDVRQAIKEALELQKVRNLNILNCAHRLIAIFFKALGDDEAEHHKTGNEDDDQCSVVYHVQSASWSR